MDANEHYREGEKNLLDAFAGDSPEEVQALIAAAQTHFLAAIAARLTDLVGAVEPIRFLLQQTWSR